MEVMHERNAHNFPLDLASAESTTVALSALQSVNYLTQDKSRGLRDPFFIGELW